jgi:protein involved in polysaccharide export with SLBB domain
VDILDGQSVQRTLSSNSTSVLYSTAAQTADWGTLLGPGDTLNIRIFQLSDLIGRGSPKSVTLIF